VLIVVVVYLSHPPPWQAGSWGFTGSLVKPCPHCRRKVRLSPKTARKRQQSHFSATVWTGL